IGIQMICPCAASLLLESFIFWQDKFERLNGQEKLESSEFLAVAGWFFKRYFEKLINFVRITFLPRM
ncbi:MAG: hypothetical protein PHY26_00605, partial [Bacilli bacterium]|nr:hypothetical protein [Bacilli bacterium]